MSFDALPDSERLLRITVPHPDRLTAIEGASFRDEDDALEHESVRERASVLPSSPTWSGNHLWLTKADLAALDPGDDPWVLLHLIFSDGSEGFGGEHWALVRWTDQGFTLQLRSHGFDGVEMCITTGSPQTMLPLALSVDEVIANPERVFAIGDGGSGKRFRYDWQVRTYLLMREFQDEFVWGRGDSDERRYPDLAGDTTWNDGTIVTTIHRFRRFREGNGWDSERVVRTRLFPPNRGGPLSRENRASERAWGQWYPVYRTSRRRDPISTEENAVRRAWAYLRHVATTAPGRVTELVAISHAIVQGPTGFGSPSNRPADLEAVATAAVLPAFARGATFWVTGCNSHTKAPGEDEHLVQRQTLTRVEGHVRAFIRLSQGMATLHQHMTTLATAPSSDVHQQAVALVLALFEDHPDQRDLQRWQMPGPTEGGLATMNAHWRNRPGNQIRRIRGFDTRADALLAWARADSPSDARFRSALEAVDWFGAEITWDAVKERSIDSHTISEWIDRARRVLSASVHYAAAFAHLAADNGRSDVHALGGNPGMDGIHLSVTITTVDEDGATGTLSNREITGYTRSDSYSRHNLPWLLAFYARFGLFPATPLGYFDYQGLLDGSGNVPTSRTGVVTDRGFDIQTLHPTPP